MAFDLTGEFSNVSGAIANGTFDPVGINSTTFNYGTGSGDLRLPSSSSLPSVGGSAATGAGSIQAAAQSAGISGGTITPAATTGSPSATTGASVANSWFARGAIVILGFVFVAAGLSQFGVLQRVNPLGRE